MKNLILSGILVVAIYAMMSCHHRNHNHQSNNITPAQLSVSRDSVYRPVSMVSLIAEPQQFDHRRVYVDGYLHMEFESNVLYFSKDDFNYGMEKNGLSLTINKEVTRNLIGKGFQNRYVTIKGIFKKSYLGHYDVNSGGLDSIMMVDSLIKNNRR
ncbi:hypothetical protein [Mucilaginibacter sp. CSA2-8R]|uniref:hypothetical protein n=1 Tax=Mucilaginibacter sp. CSA2-8R TaxID=3141542 RepID=UPI00315C8C31